MGTLFIICGLPSLSSTWWFQSSTIGYDVSMVDLLFTCHGKLSTVEGGSLLLKGSPGFFLSYQICYVGLNNFVLFYIIKVSFNSFNIWHWKVHENNIGSPQGHPCHPLALATWSLCPQLQCVGEVLHWLFILVHILSLFIYYA